MADPHISIIRGKLRELSRGPESTGLVIVIPAVREYLAPKLTEEDFSWLQNPGVAASDVQNVAAFIFDHGITADKNFDWRDLFDKAADFLDDLMGLEEIDELKKCPIMIVGCSLGGIILKWALCLASQMRSRFQSLLSKLAGLVFFGTPHSESGDLKAWAPAQMIMGLVSRGRHLPMNAEMSRRLSEASFGFSKANFQMPILSLYETRESKLRINVFRSTSVIIVSRIVAQTNAMMEELASLDTDHKGMTVPNEAIPGTQIVTDFIARSIRIAASHIDAVPDATTDVEHIPPIGVTRTGTGRLKSLVSELKSVDSVRQTSKLDAMNDLSLKQIKHVRLPCFAMVPAARNPHFMGRGDILEKIDAILGPRNDTERLKTFSLCGLGGIGKTEIAIEYTYSRRSQYEVVLWINADSQTKLFQAFHDISKQLGLVEETKYDAVTTREIVKGWLATTNASWLLVFDNADDLELVQDFWPTDCSGSILVTSRDPLARKYLASDGVDVQPFSAESGAELLTRLTGQTGTNDEAREISQRLGGLPLALTQMAGVVNRQQLSIGELLQMYAEEQSHKDLFNSNIGRVSYQSAYQHSISTVWALEDLESKSVMLLNVLSLLDPDSIQEYILYPQGDATSPSRGYLSSPLEYHRAQKALLQASLIRRELGTKSLYIHRIVQDATRAKMTRSEFTTTYNTVAKLLLSAWPVGKLNAPGDTRNEVRSRELLPHALLLCRYVAQYEEGLDHAQDVADILAVPYLLINVLRFTLLKGLQAEAEKLLAATETVHDKAKISWASLQLKSSLTQEQVTTFEHDSNALQTELYFHRGCIAMEQNDPIAALAGFLAFREAVLQSAGNDVNAHYVALSLTHLGIAFAMNERLDEAISCFELCMSSLQDAPDFNTSTLSYPLAYRGFAFWIQGKFSEAEENCIKALEVSRAGPGTVIGTTSPIVGDIHYTLGNIFASQNRMEESLENHQRALDQFIEVCGQVHRRTAEAYVKVADHYVRLGRSEDWRSLFMQATRIFRGEVRCQAEVCRVLYKMGKAFQLQGEERDAHVVFSEAMELYSRLHPDDRRSLDELEASDFDKGIPIWAL